MIDETLLEKIKGKSCRKYLIHRWTYCKCNIIKIQKEHNFIRKKVIHDGNSDNKNRVEFYEQC